MPVSWADGWVNSSIGFHCIDAAAGCCNSCVFCFSVLKCVDVMDVCDLAESCYGDSSNLAAI